MRRNKLGLVLASLLFVFGMTLLSPIPSKGESADEPDSSEKAQHIPAFAFGFVAASALSLFWHFADKRRNPKRSANSRTPVMDYHSGQLMMPHFYTGEGEKWPWMACLREEKSREIHVFELAAVIPKNDAGYEDDIHILPQKVKEDIPFGGHVLAKSCHCVPVIMEQARGRPLIIHVELDHRE
jgi:hypothetical protein